MQIGMGNSYFSTVMVGGSKFKEVDYPLRRKYLELSVLDHPYI